MEELFALLELLVLLEEEEEELAYTGGVSTVRCEGRKKHEYSFVFFVVLVKSTDSCCVDDGVRNPFAVLVST